MLKYSLRKGAQMITSLYPVLMSEDVHQSAQFFIEHFQFQETFRSDWYISLKKKFGKSVLSSPTLKCSS